MAEVNKEQAPDIGVENSLILKRGQSAAEAELEPRQGTYSDIGVHVANAKDIEAGDPGTYTGEYKPAYLDPDADAEKRTDLPDGYVAGSYAGEYPNVNQS